MLSIIRRATDGVRNVMLLSAKAQIIVADLIREIGTAVAVEAFHWPLLT